MCCGVVEYPRCSQSRGVSAFPVQVGGAGAYRVSRNVCTNNGLKDQSVSFLRVRDRSSAYGLPSAEIGAVVGQTGGVSFLDRNTVEKVPIGFERLFKVVEQKHGNVFR